MNRSKRWLAAVTGALAIVLAPGWAAAAEPTPRTLNLQKIGGFAHKTADGRIAAAEIPAYDRLSKRLFVVTGTTDSVDVLDLTNPARPALLGSITAASLGPQLGGINSIDIRNGIVAMAVEAIPRTGNGTVVFLRAADLRIIGRATVGAVPDMLIFTPDGRHLLVANEGEASEKGVLPVINPEGSVSIIAMPTLSPDMTTLNVKAETADFRAFNAQASALRVAGVRIFSPNATSVAEDLEPEYIAVSADSRTAYVTLQENNAIAILDIASRKFSAIKPLGFKDHAQPGNGFDASDRDKKASIQVWPVKGMYMPDAIASFSVEGATYLMTANEGDSREDFFSEEARVGAHCRPTDPVFGGDPSLHADDKLGRLIVTTRPNGHVTGKDSDGRCTDLFAFGARSISIWDANINLVWDSGSQLEEITAAEAAKPGAEFRFNASNSNNAEDSRSPAKGPEPEGVTLGRFGEKIFAFVGLERIGGVIVYDVTKPNTPSFVTYLNTRTGATGDNGPEGLRLISEADSPNGKPLLVVANETSGTTSVLQIDLHY